MINSKRIVLNMFLILCVGILCACGSENSIPKEGQEYLQETTLDQDVLPESDIQGNSEDIEDVDSNYATENYNLAEEEGDIQGNPEDIEDADSNYATENYNLAEEEDDSSWKSAYVEKIKEYYSENKDLENEYSKLGFGLVYFDSDNVPELVTGLNGYYVNLYTYENNFVTPILEEWGYGAGGNPGYEYCPREAVIFNMNNDYAGLMVWLTYMRWNPDSCEMEDINDEVLNYRFVEDPNGDGLLDLNEIENADYMDEPIYFYGEKRISEEEFNSYCYKGEFEPLIGNMSYSEILSILQDEASSDEDEDYHRIYKRLLEHFMRESSYDDYRYVLDGVGDAVVYDDQRDFEFAFKDINGDGIDEMFIDNNLFIPDEDWDKAYLGPMFYFYDEEDQTIVQTYSMNGDDDISDTYYKLENGELIEVKEVMERYVDDYNPEYYCIYPDGRDEQISQEQALAMRPPYLEADYHPLTEDGVREFFNEHY